MRAMFLLKNMYLLNVFNKYPYVPSLNELSQRYPHNCKANKLIKMELQQF